MDLIVFVSSRERLLHDKDRNGKFLRWLKVPELQQYCITHIEKYMCVHIAVAAAAAMQLCMLLFCRCWLLLPFAIDELEQSAVTYNLQERALYDNIFVTINAFRGRRQTSFFKCSCSGKEAACSTAVLISANIGG